MSDMLASTIKQLLRPGTGILAADESNPTIKKRFDTIGVESTEENRRTYRDLLFSTQGVGEYISGVILFEETLGQKNSSGELFAKQLANQDMVPGIKVDKGLIHLAGTNDEKVTQGLDGLPERIAEYKAMGARFAKWRATYSITDHLPSMQAVLTNAEQLARYAAICQANDIVPIVEPEVLYDGDHSIERCAEVTERVLAATFTALRKHKVILEYIVLKPSMVLAGNSHATPSTIQQVAEETLKVLKRTVPAAVPTINFLSGGQTDEQATQHLQAMNALGNLPWKLSFSYGRALQAPSLKAWEGKADNVPRAQEALQKRAKLNYLACLGDYQDSME